MKPNKRRARLLQRRAPPLASNGCSASLWLHLLTRPPSLAVSDTPCDVCASPGTRPVRVSKAGGQPPVELPLCWDCALLLTEAALHAVDQGCTPARAAVFGWKVVREERGQQP